jgi:hypothetical protein
LSIVANYIIDFMVFYANSVSFKRNEMQTIIKIMNIKNNVGEIFAFVLEYRLQGWERFIGASLLR